MTEEVQTTKKGVQAGLLTNRTTTPDECLDTEFSTPDKQKVSTDNMILKQGGCNGSGETEAKQI